MIIRLIIWNRLMIIRLIIWNRLIIIRLTIWNQPPFNLMGQPMCQLAPPPPPPTPPHLVVVVAERVFTAPPVVVVDVVPRGDFYTRAFYSPHITRFRAQLEELDRGETRALHWLRTA